MANLILNKAHIVILSAVFVASVTVGFCVVSLFKKAEPERIISESGTGSSAASGAGSFGSGSTGKAGDKSKQESEATIPVVESVSKPLLNRGKYSFTVKATVQSGDPLELFLMDSTKVVISSNNDGIFTNVSPSKSPYWTGAKNLKTGQISDLLMITDCIIPKEVLVERVSKEKLSAMINKGDYAATFGKMWVREHLSPGCKLNFTGLRQGEIIPNSIADLCDRVLMEGWKCTVTQIEYNEKNMVTRMVINVKYPEAY